MRLFFILAVICTLAFAILFDPVATNLAFHSVKGDNLNERDSSKHQQHLDNHLEIKVAESVDQEILPSSNTSESGEQGIQIGGGEFSLIDQENHIVTNLSLLDQYTLMFFGFSRCPSICPDTLTMLSSVIEKMAGKVVVYFITIDPEYDTVEVLKEFHKAFHKDIKMLTGSKEEIEKVRDQYKVYANIDKSNPLETTHSAIVYLIGKTGNYDAHFTTLDPDQVVRELKVHISS